MGVEQKRGEAKQIKEGWGGQAGSRGGCLKKRGDWNLHMNYAVTAETKYSIDITQSKKKMCLSLHYSGTNSVLYANGVKIYQFKAKD